MSTANPMLEPRITKVIVHIGVGEGGERLQQAERVLTLLTGGNSIRSVGKTTNRDLKVREGAPIGCKVTMRDQSKMKKFLEDAFWVREKTLPAYNVDSQGNLSFGGVVMDPIWKSSVSLGIVLLPIVLMMLISIISSLYPASIAARIKPIEAIHYKK